MSDELRISIPVFANFKNIKSEISQYIKEIESKGIHLNTKEIETGIKNVQSSFIGLAKNSQTINESTGETVKLVRTFNEGLGQTRKEISQVDVVTGELERTLTEIIVDYKKINDETEKQTIKQQKLNEKIELYKKNMAISISSLRDGKYKGLVNESDLTKLENSVKTLSSTTPNAVHQMNMMKTGLRDIESGAKKTYVELQNASKYTNVFGQSLFEAGKKFGGWLLIGNMIMTAIRSVKFGVQTIIDLDKEMVNLKKVTDDTTNSYNRFYTSIGSVATVLGKTTQEMIRSTTEFARLGYELSTATTLAKEAIILANVGDMGIDDATSSLISTLKGFHIEVDEYGKNVRRITDAANEVANNFAISQEGIANALKLSASSLYTAGNTLEQSIALLTGANAVVQDPNKVGTAFKTVSMRLRGIVDEGEEVEALMPKLDKAFADIGMTLKKDENTFKSTYDILAELAVRWNDVNNAMTDFEKANILELVAGKRQGNIIASLLGNWDDAEKALETALNSSGSAMVEFTKYIDSIEYKTNRAKNSIITFWQDGLDSKFFKSAIDSFTVLTYGVTQLTNMFGLLPSILAPVSIGFITLNKNFREFIASSFIGNWSQGIMLGLTNLATKFGITSISIRGATIAMRAFQATLTFGASIALGVILDKLITKFGSYADKVTDTTDQQLEFIQANKTTVDNIDELIAKLESGELSYQEQIDVQKQIAQILPDATTGYTDQNSAIAENIELIKSLNEEKKKELQLQAYGIISNVGGDVEQDARIKQIKAYNQRIDELSNELSEILRKNPTGYVMGKNRAEQIQEEMGEYAEKINELTSKAKEANYAYKIVNETVGTNYKTYNDLFSVLFDVTEETKKNTKANIDNGDSLLEQESKLTKLQSTLSSSIQTISSMQKALDEYNNSGKFNLETIINLAKDYPELLDHLNNEQSLRKELTNIIDEEQSKMEKIYKQNLMYSEEFYNQNISAVEDYVKELGLQRKVDLDGAKSLAQAKLKIENELLGDLAEKWADYYNAQGEFIGKIAGGGRAIIGVDGKPIELTEKVKSEMLEYERIIKETQKRFDDITLNAKGLDFSPSSTSSSTPTPSLSSFNLYEDTIAALDHQIKQLNDKLESDPSLAVQLQVKLDLKKQVIEAEQKEIQAELDKTMATLRTFEGGATIASKIVSGEDVSNIETTNEELADVIKKVLDLRSASRQLESSLYDVNKEFKAMLTTLDKIYDQKLGNIISDIDKDIKAIQDAEKAYVDSMNQRIKEVESSYDSLIEAKRKEIELLERQNELEERNLKLKELEKQMADVLADTRFEYITSEGELIYTYDKGKYNELLTEREQLLAEYAKQDVINAKKAELDALEEAKNREVKILQDEVEATKQANAERIANMQAFQNQLKELQDLEFNNLKTNIDAKITELKRYEDAWKAHRDSILAIQDELSNVGVPSGGGTGNDGTTDLDSALRQGMIDQSTYDNLRQADNSDFNPNNAYGHMEGGRVVYDYVPSHHSGGITGDQPPNKTTDLLNKIANTNANEQVIKSLIGELNIPPQNINRFLVPNIGKMVGSFANKVGQGISKTYNIHVDEIKANNINDFIKSINYKVQAQG